jgi:RNA-binding protein YlmH
MESDELLAKRFIELANLSYKSGIYTFTDFLGLAEQSVFDGIKKALHGIPYEAFGGAPGAERVMIRFGNEEALGYEVPFPIVCIKAEPVSQKFADKLTHRDFLGALLNVGIERETLGDIPIRGNVGYVFASEDIAPFILSELTRVKHTDIRLSVADSLPEGELYKTERKCVQISSERLDAVIARLFSLSREDAQSLFAKKLVFTSGRQCVSTSYQPKENETISVRGHGRFIYRGFVSNSKKGKLNVEVDVYV